MLASSTEHERERDDQGKQEEGFVNTRRKRQGNINCQERGRKEQNTIGELE